MTGREGWTRWGRSLDPDAVLPEHPRPQLVRDSYVNLNGWWDYAITAAGGPDGRGDAPAAYDGRILVPFSPEAALSGVGRQLQPDEWLWYHRTVEVPPVPAGHRTLLHAGAVDQSCTVWLDGVEVGRHEGGYLPFTVEVTEVVGTGGGLHDLVVGVRDLGDGRGPASGKQRLERGGIWYTAQSGIWQTVWLEQVPPVFVEHLELLPHRTPSGRAALDVRVVATAGHRAEVRLVDGGRVVATATAPTGVRVRVLVPEPRWWSPGDPHLYDVDVRLGLDVVRGQVGLRTVGTGTGPDGHPCFLLNGDPFQHVGVLDQGYWPEGLMTPPADAAVVHDLETARELGFTVVRKHGKVEPLRWYHHCDRLGLLVWQDLPNGGGRYHDVVVGWPGRRRGRRLRLSDRRHRLFARGDAAERARFEEDLRRTVALLRSVTALAVWVPFNEGWGQFDAVRLTALLHALDPGRPVDHASGWHDQGAGEVWSHHVYARAFARPSRRPGDDRVLALTEYGGVALAVAGHGTPTPFGYGTADDPRQLADDFTALHRRLAALVPEGLRATVYTQLCDVEDEVNGLLTYDREVLKLPADVVRAALAPLRSNPAQA